MEQIEIESKLLNYLTSEENADTDVLMKNYLKHLISDYLKLPFSDFNGTERTHLYEFTKKRLKTFKKESKQKDLDTVTNYLKAHILGKLANIREERKQAKIKRILSVIADEIIDLDKEKKEVGVKKEELLDLTNYKKSEFQPVVKLKRIKDPKMSNTQEVLFPPSFVKEMLPKPTEKVQINPSSRVEMDQDESPSIPETERRIERNSSPVLEIDFGTADSPDVQEIPPEPPIDLDTPPVSDREDAPPPAPITPSPVVKKPKKKCFSSKNPNFDVTKFAIGKNRENFSLMLRTNPNEALDKIFKLDFENHFLAVKKSSKDIPSNIPFVELSQGPCLSLQQLFYWPNVQFSFKTLGLEINRVFTLNSEYELIKSTYEPQAITTKNSKDIHCFFSNQSMAELMSNPDKKLPLPHDFIILYLELIEKVIQVHIKRLPKSKEILQILQIFLTDLKRLPNSFQHQKYSYFLNDQKYDRKFNESIETQEDEFTLKETINPEVIFSIDQCNLDLNEKTITNYFAELLEGKNVAALRTFNMTLMKGIQINCSECNYSVHGPMSQLLIQEHLKGFCAIEFKCLKCDFKRPQMELSDAQWKHSCTEKKDD